MEYKIDKNINILTCGFGSSSHTYLFGVCERIMRKANILKGSSDDVFVYQDNILGIFEKKYNPYTVIKAMAKYNLLGSHENLKLWYNSEAWRYFDRILYVHRDVRDCMVVITKYHCISDLEDYEETKYKYIARNDLRTFLSKDNPLKYNIFYKDMKQCSPWIIDHLKGWREHIIEFLKIKERSKNVYEFRFDERKKDVEKDIQKIINVLGVDLSKNMYSELMLELENAGYDDCHPNEIKFKNYKEFYNEDEINLMNSVAGDALCTMKYMSIEEYSSFIGSNESFTIVNIDEDNEFVEDAIFLLKKLGKEIKSVIHVSKNSNNLELIKNNKYLLFSRDIQNSLFLMKRAGLIEGKEYIFYPYYNVYKDYQVKLFNIGKRYTIDISSLFNDSVRNMIVIYDKSEFTNNMILPRFKKVNGSKEKKIFLIPEGEYNIEEVNDNLKNCLENIKENQVNIILAIKDLNNLKNYLQKLKIYYDQIYAFYPMYDFESENPYMKKIKELWGRDIEAEEALSNKILALYIEGKSLLKKGQYIKAEEKLNYALSLEPIDKNIEASILLTLGDIYLEQKRYFESEKKYKEAILKEPWYKNIKANILINYANLYFRQKK